MFKLPNNPISIQNDIRSIIQKPVSELEQVENCYKSESAGVRWKLESWLSFPNVCFVSPQ